jgi:spore coat polysaccharide biosynthesis predicted glycosyltransferase SpsG
MNKTKKKIKKNFKIKKILIHAGGSSAYKLINNFFSTSVKYLLNKDVTVDILYNNIKTSIQIKRKINYLINSSVKFKLLKFNRKFSKKLQNYDLIAGPAGTTTFEAMSSGVLTFSFPLVKDGRDSMLSWNLLGNVTHLNFREKNEKYIIQSMWDYIF